MRGDLDAGRLPLDPGVDDVDEAAALARLFDGHRDDRREVAEQPAPRALLGTRVGLRRIVERVEAQQSERHPPGLPVPLVNDQGALAELLVVDDVVAERAV